MPNSKTPQMPPQAPKTAAPTQSQKDLENVPAAQSAVASDGIGTADPNFQGTTIKDFEAGSGETPDPTPLEMKAGTPENPKTLPLPTEEIKAYAMIRSTDGMWRAVRYKIKGAKVLEVRTKEPDIKALLAAQVTDCLALDMPLFNDEDGPRE